MANIYKELTGLPMYQSLCSTLCQDLPTVTLGCRFCHQLIINIQMKKLGLIQDHTDNKWWIRDLSPVDAGLGLCTALPPELLHLSILPTTACEYILVMTIYPHCEEAPWPLLNFTSAMLSSEPPSSPVV